MSKYEKQGAYHYAAFKDVKSAYYKHMIDVMEKVRAVNPTTVFDVGCGEGFLVHQLMLTGVNAHGCDIDPAAVRLARVGDRVHLGTVDEALLGKVDLITCLDVLEHVKDFEGTLDFMIGRADLLILAVPDRHDPHGERQNVHPMIVKHLKAKGWTMAHHERRHARDLSTWEKK